MVWVKANFVCDKAGKYFVRVNPPMLDAVSLYAVEDGIWTEQKGGYFAKRNEIRWHSPNWTFEFSGNAGDTVPVFMRFKSDLPMLFSVYVGDSISTNETLAMWTL